MAAPFSLGTPFLKTPGSPAKCELCDQGAEMSRNKRLPFPQPTWEVPALPTAWKVKLLCSHRFLLFLSESFTVKPGCSGRAVLLP